MWLFVWDSEPSKIFVGDTPISKVFVWDKQVRPATPVELPYLCFTANTAWSTVQLTKTWSPTVVTLETSTDWNTWTTYTFWDTITLSNIGDKVYWRNTSGTDTWFSTGSSNLYQFVMSGSVAWSGDVNYLLNKNSTTTLSSDHCYRNLFYGCAALTSAPSLPATTLANYCYYNMFYWCKSLTTIPSLPATTLTSNCYYQMFYWCSLIKISSSWSSAYPTEYRIPSSWTWTVSTNSLYMMFRNTWWTFKATPTINKTYYANLNNTVIDP